MKTFTFLFILMLNSFTLSASAADYFISGDVSPLVMWRNCRYVLDCSSQGSDDNQSYGYGFRLGAYDKSINTGLELGYDQLGGNSGSTDYFLSPGCFWLCSGATATWKNDATISYVDIFGYVPKQSKESNYLIGKIGIYNSSIDTKGNYGLGGRSYQRQVVGTGLMMGAGYISPFTEHLSGRLAADIFFNVQVADPKNSGSTLSEIFTKLSLGLDFTF